MARNVLLKHRVGDNWEELHPLTKITNVFTADGTPLSDIIIALDFIHVGTSEPKDPDLQYIWIDTNDKRVKYWENGNWEIIGREGLGSGVTLDGGSF